MHKPQMIMQLILRSTTALLLYCASLTLMAAEILTDATPEILVKSSLHILQDTAGALSIEQLTANEDADPFSTDLKDYPHVGYINTDYWYRFELKNESVSSWYLFIDYPLMKTVDAYIQTLGNPDTAPTQLVRHENRLPAYPLSLKKGQSYRVYIKVHASKTQLHVPIRLMQTAAFIDHSQNQYIFFSMVFAGLSILAIYNLFLYFSLRTPSYLSLVAFILSIQLMFYRENAIFPALNFLNNPEHYFFSAPALLAFAAGLHYWGHFDLGDSRILRLICRWVPLATLAALPFIGLSNQTHSTISIVCIFLGPVVIAIVVHKAYSLGKIRLRTSLSIVPLILLMQPYLYNHSGLFLSDFSTSIYLANAGVLLALLSFSITQAEYTRILREQNERAEAISKTKDEFLTTMSHELRTPMTVILGSNSLLQKTPLNIQQRNYLDKQKTATTHMIEVINQVLDLSSIEKQVTRIRQEPFQLTPIIEQINDLFTDQASSKNLQFNIETDPAIMTGEWLKGDSTRLLQVLINLLGNSIKFTDHGFAKLHIAKVTDTPERITLRFTVTDSGPGIAPEHLTKLFKPFSQLDASPSRQKGGTGLGLAISYKLVQLMGGTLALSPQQEAGSQFSFELPFPRINAINTVTTNRQIKGMPRILLVDDDDLGRFISEEILKEQQLDVATADSGQSALDALKNEQFDLVLMDISMPGMDGYEATRHIRTKLKLKTLPVIALTAHAINGERTRCLNAGMNDYLAKPFEPQALKNIIALWLKPQITKP